MVGMGRLLGAGGWYFHVLDMAVLPDHQRRGLGARTSASWPTRLVSASMSATVSLLPPRSRSAWLRSSVDD